MKYEVLNSFRQALSPREQVVHKKGTEIEVDEAHVKSWIDAGFIKEQSAFESSIKYDPISFMTKDELEVYARNKFGVDLDRRKSLPKLRKQVKGLEA